MSSSGEVEEVSQTWVSSYFPRFLVQSLKDPTNGSTKALQPQAMFFNVRGCDATIINTNFAFSVTAVRGV